MWVALCEGQAEGEARPYPQHEAQANLHEHAVDDHGFVLATFTAELPSPIAAIFLDSPAQGSPTGSVWQLDLAAENSLRFPAVPRPYHGWSGPLELSLGG